MSKWKCEICSSEFENYHAQGFDNTIYCPLCYFKKLYKDTELEREKLQNLLQQKENIIKEGREYIESYNLEYLHETNEHNLADILEELLEILDKGGIK